MIRTELEEVIQEFQTALEKNKLPKFSSLHRAEQVLRILKVDYADFYVNETKRCGVNRHLWSDNPDV